MDKTETFMAFFLLVLLGGPSLLLLLVLVAWDRTGLPELAWLLGSGLPVLLAVGFATGVSATAALIAVERFQ